MLPFGTIRHEGKKIQHKFNLSRQGTRVEPAEKVLFRTKVGFEKKQSTHARPYPQVVKMSSSTKGGTDVGPTCNSFDLSGIVETKDFLNSKNKFL